MKSEDFQGCPRCECARCTCFDQFLQAQTFEFPTLEEVDTLIAQVEAVEGLPRYEINMRTRELRKIRKNIIKNQREDGSDIRRKRR